MVYNRETWIKNNKDKLDNRKCKICNIKLDIGKKHGKELCRKCRNDLYYEQDWEARVKRSKLDGTKKRPYKYYEDYLKRNPEQKEMNSIRQRTYHKYGKALICSVCSSKVIVQHHHLYPYAVDNFIDLCSSCHKKYYHRKYNKQELKSKLEGKEK